MVKPTLTRQPILTCYFWDAFFGLKTKYTKGVARHKGDARLRGKRGGGEHLVTPTTRKISKLLFKISHVNFT